jgi:exosome complex RNA-binding protein Rrp42 (RNase PH superfamily)
VTRRVSDALRDAKVLDLTQLCIKEGVFVWKVCVDVYCLDHDGSVLDAALAACVGALRDCAVPFVAVDERGKLSWGGAGKRKRGDAQQEGEGGEGAGVEGAAGEDADASTSAACVVEVHHTPFSLTTGLYKVRFCMCLAGGEAIVPQSKSLCPINLSHNIQPTDVCLRKCVMRKLNAAWCLPVYGRYAPGQLIVDPDAEEEALMDAVVSVAMTEDGQLVGVLKPGGTAEASETTLMHCVAAAKVRLYKLIAVDDP